jgi:hypothetical protein
MTCRSRHAAVWRASLVVGLVDTRLGGYPVVHTLVCARCPTVLCEVSVVNRQAGTSTCIAHAEIGADAPPAGAWWHG